MADLTMPAVERVAPIRYAYGDADTAPAAAAVNAGQPCYKDANGKWAVADASASGTLGKPGQRGIAITTATLANQAITVVTKGELDMGDALGGLAIGAAVYASDTAGTLADAAGTATWLIGYVDAVWGATTPDKSLRLIGA